MAISVNYTNDIAVVGLPSSGIMQEVRDTFDVFTRPDRDDEIILDVRDFDEEQMSELFGALDIEHDSSEAKAITEAEFLFIFVE